MLTMRQIGRSAALYPISMLYAAGVAVVCGVASSALSPEVGVTVLAFVAILAAVYATWRELRKVHKLVDGQRTELLERIDQLSGLLTESGVSVPLTGEAEQNARNDTIRKGLQ